MKGWINYDGVLKTGECGFLVESNIGALAMWWLQTAPLRTDASEPRLIGSCGEKNSVTRYARGMAKIIQVSPKGDRAFIESIHGEELAKALETAGYPELTQQEA